MHRDRTHDDWVSASELAQLGACERVVRFEALYGRRRTAAQRQAVARGLVEHARFYEESRAIIAASERKGQCFVATLSLGDCDDTKSLRAYRDLVLRRSVFGRWFIRQYYAAGPTLAGFLRRHPTMIRLVAVLLRWGAALARQAIERTLRGS
jgi:hypothetical protein